MPGNCAIYRSWVTGDQLTASDLTTSFTTVGVTNMTASCLDDYSQDATQMQSVTDPYPAAVISLSTSLAGELERIRYVLKNVFGLSQWYAHSENLDFGARDITTTGKLVVTKIDAIAAKGDLLGGTAADTFGVLTVGANDTVLVAASGEATGLKWATLDATGAIVKTIVDAKGDLISASAADTPARLAVGSNGHVLTADSAEATGLKWTSVGMPRSYLTGLGLAINSGDTANDLDIAVGEARDKDDTEDIALSGALTKQIDVAWAVGTNQGMLATGAAVQANATYHIFVIKRPDTGVVDIAADTSATGANIEANTNAAYTKRRRIGSIVRASSSNRAFIQRGDEFRLDTPVLDLDNTSVTSPASTITLSVPTGLRYKALLNVLGQVGNTGGNRVIYFTDPDNSDIAVSASAAPLGQVGVGVGATDNGATGTSVEVWTNTSAQVRARASAAVTTWIATRGWIDRRGRDD